MSADEEYHTVEMADALADATAMCASVGGVDALNDMLVRLDYPTVYDEQCLAAGWDPLEERDMEVLAWSQRRYEPPPEWMGTPWPPGNGDPGSVL